MEQDAVMARERLNISNFRCFVLEFGLYPKDKVCRMVIGKKEVFYGQNYMRATN